MDIYTYIRQQKRQGSTSNSNGDEQRSPSGRVRHWTVHCCGPCYRHSNSLLQLDLRFAQGALRRPRSLLQEVQQIHPPPGALMAEPAEPPGGARGHGAGCPRTQALHGREVAGQIRVPQEVLAEPDAERAHLRRVVARGQDAGEGEPADERIGLLR